MEMLHQEFHECVYWAAMCFASGVALREWAPHAIGRNIGRFNVLMSMVILVSFGSHSVRMCHVYYSGSQVVKNGKGIVHKMEDESTKGPTEVSRQVRTPAGHVVSVEFNADRDRPVSGTADGSRWSFSGRGFSDRSTGRGFTDCRGTIGSVGRLPLVNPSLSELK